MKARILLLTTLSLLNLNVFCQIYEWAKQVGGNLNDSGYAITVDGAGNVYTTGWFTGIVDFDPGVGTETLTGAGSGDIFVQKLDSSGNFIWAKRMGGIFYEYGVAIAVDNDGNVF
ncbi:MAG: SBBP repeat-containing protein, partial [Bacteroidetes bacterium]|nr:SBBP repeat-containing protein [Bacteroidota bacterium]